MSHKKNDPDQIYAARRRQVSKQLAGGSALFISGEPAIKARDVEYPFAAESNFFYLTGLNEPSSALLLLDSNRGPRSVLFVRERDKATERWVGERLGIRRARKRYHVDEVRDSSELGNALPELLKNSTCLHYAPGISKSVDQFVFSLFQNSHGPCPNFPNSLIDSRLILSELRWKKGSEEIQSIRHAVDITAHAFIEIIPTLRKYANEQHAAVSLESLFAKRGACSLAFPTIVAAGKNATILHHAPSRSPLWKKELVLIDAGASFQGYAADISRTVPVSGRFTTAQAEVYDLVLEALEAGLERAVPGSTMERIHRRVVGRITRGLSQLGILSGTVSSLVRKMAYRPYFMHRSGHWLGLDVHDISPLGSPHPKQKPSEREFEPGNVFTLEPGLYFDPKDETVPPEFRGIGVRIEEDILITNKGHEVLTAAVPRNRADIEALY